MKFHDISRNVSPTLIFLMKLNKYWTPLGVFLGIQNVEGSLDGVIGFEPMDDGIKIRWLTACRHPNIELLRTSEITYFRPLRQ